MKEAVNVLDYGSGKALEERIVGEIIELGKAVVENQQIIIQQNEKILETLEGVEVTSEEGDKKEKGSKKPQN